MNNTNKIVLPKKIQQKMVAFFWKTSIPRMLKEK